MSELWDKRLWQVNNQIGKEWMFISDESDLLAFYGPSPGNNEAHPPWTMPDYPTYILPGVKLNLTYPGSVFYDPLNAFEMHFIGLNIPENEKYLRNPYQCVWDYDYDNDVDSMDLLEYIYKYDDIISHNLSHFASSFGIVK